MRKQIKRTAPMLARAAGGFVGCYLFFMVGQPIVAVTMALRATDAHFMRVWPIANRPRIANPPHNWRPEMRKVQMTLRATKGDESPDQEHCFFPNGLHGAFDRAAAFAGGSTSWKAGRQTGMSAPLSPHPPRASSPRTEAVL